MEITLSKQEDMETPTKEEPLKSSEKPRKVAPSKGDTDRTIAKAPQPTRTASTKMENKIRAREPELKQSSSISQEERERVQKDVRRGNIDCEQPLLH